MTATEQPFLSIVTPCYNGADFIGECIESVLKQTYRNFEYIVVNNCSKDATLEIAQGYARRDSRIRVHDNTDFLPVMVNHNHAVSLIAPASKYCKIVSADDWIFPDCVRQMVELAEANPSVGIVGSYSIAGKQVLWEGLEYEQKVVNGREICRNTLLGKTPYVLGAPTTLLYRADLVRKTPAFFPLVGPHADMSACYQALEHSDFGFIHQVLSFTRIHTDSQTSNSFKLGTVNRALLDNVARFGPLYLSPEELKEHTEIALDKYYEWLVPALFENSLDRGFLQIQKDGLKEIGFEFSTARALKAALARGAELLESPGATTRKISAMLKRKGKLEARGPSMT